MVYLNQAITLKMKTKITVECTINSTIEKVWKSWTTPEDIVKWNFASEDWYAPKAINDLTVGGKFVYTMSSKDGSMSFDFYGNYTEILLYKSIKYHTGDDRAVSIEFIENGSSVQIIETFEAEDENPIEMQRFGWQAILDNFKKHAESL